MHDDIDLLQGTWTVTELELEGQKMAGALLANARIVIKGLRFNSTGMGVEYKGRLVLDTSTNPRQFDMKFDAGPEKGNTNLGIYKLDGDTWKICLAMRGTVRPSRFASTSGSGFAVETLIRGGADVIPKAKARPAAKTKQKNKPNAAPATEFEGEWRMVSGVMDGIPMDESTVQWVKRVTVGNETTVYAGPQVMMKFEVTSDSSKSPKTIDYINTGGANKGKSQLGIYEFKENLLRICIAAPGGPRPAQFQSTPGSGRTLSEWKRE